MKIYYYSFYCKPIAGILVLVQVTIGLLFKLCLFLITIITVSLWYKKEAVYPLQPGCIHTLFMHYPCSIYAPSINYLYFSYEGSTKDEVVERR
jgi:hypothetical protein